MELTALQIVNEVQRDLRLPQSVDFNSAHAKLILSYVNRVQMDIMTPACAWRELQGFATSQTILNADVQSLTTMMNVTIPSAMTFDKLSTINYMGIDTEEILLTSDASQFRKFKTTTPGKPTHYRVRTYNSATDVLTVEYNCPCDAAYTLTLEGSVKPPLLVLETDVPLLPAETIVIGTILLAKTKQGQDVTFDIAIWKDNFSQISGNNNPGGDMDFL